MASKEHLARLNEGVDAWNAWRKAHPEIHPDLRGTDLTATDLSRADLSRADLTLTDLSFANLSRANLSFADLSFASLIDVTLSSTNLTEAILTKAALGSTILAHLDLSQVRGLETVEHHYPSSIGVDTIYTSRGQIPEVFLRGVGVPDSFIESLRSLVPSTAIDSSGCFLSYSSHDQAFAERLHADLRAKGVRCWFAPHALKIGASIRPTIDASIRLHDKLLLVLSRASIASQWAEQEVEKALERERNEQRLVLVLVRLDQAVMQIEDGWPASIRNTRTIGDFTRWKDHDVYQQAFTRLLRDLKAEAS